MSTPSITAPLNLPTHEPLRRRTVYVVVGLVMAMLMLGAWVQTPARSPVDAAKPVEAARLEKTASRALEVELAQVRPPKTSTIERPALPLPESLPPPPLTPSTSPSVVPSASGRDDAAQWASRWVRQGPGSVPAPDELEASGRVSKSLVLDDLGQKTSAPSGLGPLGLAAAASSWREAAMSSAAGGSDLTAAPPRERAAPDRSAYLQVVGEGLKQQRRASAQQADATKAWLTELGEDTGDAAVALKPKTIEGPWVLAQGKLLPAVLQRNLNSDLPGEVVAQTLVDVYDSFEGRTLLIPKGSTLVGQYASAPNLGQERLMFAFTRLILPNRTAFDLPVAKGMDSGGMAGSAAEVDNHFWKLFSTSFVVAWLATRAEAGVPSGTTINTGSNAMAARTAAGHVLIDVSSTALNRYKSLGPTLTVPIGTRINVQVVRDMVFPSAYAVGSR